MLALTRKTDYALVALSFLGMRRNDFNPSASAREISEAYGMPLPVTMSVLKTLTRAGIVSSTRGAQGGYELVAEPQAVTLTQVFTAMEGPLQFAPCAHEEPELGKQCSIECDCPIREPIRRLHSRLLRFFDDVTLADLIDSEVQVWVEEVVVEQTGERSWL